MELKYAFLADTAEMMPDGRFFVLGGGIDGFTVPHCQRYYPRCRAIACVIFNQTSARVIAFSERESCVRTA